MNNKGQVLVVFVILLPIFLLILGFVIDYGLLYSEKKNIDDSTHDALNYYLNNLDDSNIYDKTIKLLNSNISDAEVNINVDENFVEIAVSKKYNGFYKNFYDNNIEVKYKGIKSSKKIIKG